MISFGSTLNCKNLVFYTPVFTLNSKKNIVHSTGLNFIWCEINIFINKSYFLYMWLPLFAWPELVVIWALWKVWYQKLKQVDILLHSQVLIGHSNSPYKIVYFLLENEFDEHWTKVDLYGKVINNYYLINIIKL